jgi:hypothetical protein
MENVVRGNHAGSYNIFSDLHRLGMVIVEANRDDANVGE